MIGEYGCFLLRGRRVGEEGHIAFSAQLVYLLVMNKETLGVLKGRGIEIENLGMVLPMW